MAGILSIPYAIDFDWSHPKRDMTLEDEFECYVELQKGQKKIDPL